MDDDRGVSLVWFTPLKQDSSEFAEMVIREVDVEDAIRHNRLPFVNNQHPGVRSFRVLRQ